MIDELNNEYFFKNAIVNFKNNEIIADGIKIDFLKVVLEIKKMILD